MNDIVILQQIADTLQLYLNCVKKGYTKFRYFTDPDIIYTIESEKPELTLSGLVPGIYYFYAENQTGDETGHGSVTVSGLSKQTIFSNIAMGRNITIDDNIIHSLSAEHYITELYQQLLKEKISEETFLAFIEFYNARQEELNAEVSEFIIQDQTILSRTELLYRFAPYVYVPNTDSWKFIPEQTVGHSESATFSGKPSQMYRISVLSDFNVVRIYYIYHPSENVSTAILERKIRTRQNQKEILTEQTVQINLESIANDAEGIRAVCSLLHFKPEHVIFRRPDIMTDGSSLICHVPDYPCIALSGKPIYLAVLELEEVFSDIPQPHRYQITAEDFTMSVRHFLLNQDTEYVYYLTDESGKIMSDPALLSLNTEYPTNSYMESYTRTTFDTYVRKLYITFKEYGKEKWNVVSQLLDQYLLSGDTSITFHEFLWKQLLCLNPEREPIDRLIEIVILCRLWYDTDIDSHFIQHQVYSKEFHDHVFPEWDHPYIVRAIRFNHGDLAYDYYLAGNESLNLAMNRDEYVLFECIDPDTWNSSAPVFYNNRIRSGSPYMYFPKLEVEVI